MEKSCWKNLYKYSNQDKICSKVQTPCQLLSKVNLYNLVQLLSVLFYETKFRYQILSL